MGDTSDQAMWYWCIVVSKVIVGKFGEQQQNTVVVGRSESRKNRLQKAERAYQYVTSFLEGIRVTKSLPVRQDACEGKSSAVNNTS